MTQIVWSIMLPKKPFIAQHLKLLNKKLSIQSQTSLPIGSE
ncbi:MULTISPECIES: hypothetical protein [unclassified Gilliamella]|nr:hypothetical protein [Gilliamella apicola]